MYKIYRYIAPENQPVSQSIHPGHIIFPDQLTRHLPKVQNIVLGERRRSVYYDRYSDGEYVEPIVKIDYAYKRQETGLVYLKIRTISWMLENDRWSREVQSDRIPVINEAQKLLEIKRRRSNVISELKGLAKKYSTEQFNLEGKTLEIFEEFQLYVNSYVDAGSSKLKNAIATYDADWLDVANPETGNKPRDIFLTYFSIGLGQ